MLPNLLETIFDCNGTDVTVATPRVVSPPPPEPLADLRDRHNKAVRDAKEDCESTPPQAKGALIATWTAAVGSMLYASPTAYGQAAHDADVLKLKSAGYYPPVS